MNAQNRHSNGLIPGIPDGLNARIITDPRPGPNDCWLVSGARKGRSKDAGYATYGDRSNPACHGELYTHRIVWRALHPDEDIPPGYEVDHTCRTRNCINPAHLELVTLQENRRRRKWQPRVQGPPAPPTGMCKRGHDWAEHGRPNTQRSWVCRACARVSVAA